MPCEVCVTDAEPEITVSLKNCDCLIDDEENSSNGGVSKIAELKLENYATGEATNISKIDGKPFTIVKVVDSDYEGQDGIVQGIRIETKESFDIEGNSFNKFYTTRTVIVSKFFNKEKVPSALTTAILAGGELKVKTISKQSSKGRSYFDFEQA